MRINARSVFLCYKHGAKQMIAQGRGGRLIGEHRSRLDILNCIADRNPHISVGASSGAGKKGGFSSCVYNSRYLTKFISAMPLVDVYSASKFAVRGLTQSAGNDSFGIHAGITG